MSPYKSENDHRADEITILCYLGAIAIVAFVFLVFRIRVPFIGN